MKRSVRQYEFLVDLLFILSGVINEMFKLGECQERINCLQFMGANELCKLTMTLCDWYESGTRKGFEYMTMLQLAWIIMWDAPGYGT